MLKKKNIYPDFVSKHNSKGWKVILSMILNGERWHFYSVKNIPALLRVIMSKYHIDVYCRHCLHPFSK